MIDRPLRYVGRFAEAGADLINVHIEADTEKNTIEALRKIRALGKKSGVTLKPATPFEAALPFIGLSDLVLVMTVEPGFGGQSFMPDMLSKARDLRSYIDMRGLDCLIEVDGGINPETAAACIAAGADVLVAGSDIFGAADKGLRIAQLRGTA